MATEVGEVAIKLTLQGDIEKAASNAATKAGGALNKLGSVAKTAGKVVATGIAAGTAAVSALAKSAVSAYADWEQLIGGVETLFKDSASVVDQYAQQAYKTAGLSANQYMETVTSFSASLLQSLGGDTAKAAEYGNQAVIDMSDNANKMGTDMQRIQDAYQGFAKQNYTMLDNLKLGYGGTKTEMERLLADASKISGIKFNIDSFADVTQAIHVIQENMGIAGTTAQEAEQTISGSLNMVKASWGNLLAFMGGGTTMAWDDIFPAFVDSVKTFASNLITPLGDVIYNIGNIVNELAPIISAELPGLINRVLPNVISAATTIVNGLISALPGLIVGLTNGLLGALPALIQGISQALVGIVQALPSIIPTLINGLLNLIPDLISGVTDVVNAIIEQLPVILPAIINGLLNLVLGIANALTQPDFLQTILQAGITLFMSLVQVLPDVLIALIDALPQIIDNIITFLTAPATISMLIGAAVQLFFALVQAVPRILGALIGAFGSMVGSLWKGIKSLFGAFASKFGEFIGGIFKGALNGVLGFIENFINAPIRLINGFIDVINGAFGFIGVSLGRISEISLPRLATGGIVVGPGTATSDSIPVLLSNGEYVINAKAAKSIGYDNLDILNSRGDLSAIQAAINTDLDDLETSDSSREKITVNMNNYINNEMDADDIGRRLMTSIRRAA